MVKHIQGWDISSKLQNKHKVYVRSFSSAKVKSMKDYSKPCIKEDKPDHLMLHVGTNDLASGNTAERIAKSIADLAKGLVYLFIYLLTLFEFGVNPSSYLHKET